MYAMDKIVVYTVITGKKDKLIEQDFPVKIFLDSYDKFKDERRNSRIQKILAHKYIEADYSVYMDGNMKLLISPEELIRRYMNGYDMALFAHGGRDCIYDEAMECAKLKLDDQETIIEQAKYYEDHEYAKHKGLLQGGFIIRRHNNRTERFNEAWWADFCRFSRRDQLSLMPAIDASGVIVNTMHEHWIDHYDGTAHIGDILEMRSHAHLEGNFNDPNINK